ncbi:hypothetical protein [Chitinophaga sp. CB10]|uniref:hypothetical protein n=1 Tax=Chitinophaga sp. CB10 TaxID=1891659 RepID=UPI0025C68B99|nr:hypothetical protein [Chitinophaga sp. CB10]
MKNIFYTFLVLAVVVLAGCKKDDDGYSNDFNNSYKAWMSFKAASGNSYRYQVTSSSWTGLSTETTITVQSGKVIRRSFIAKNWKNNVPPVMDTLQRWEEDEATLGTNSAGFEPLTLDGVYKKAEEEWLVKRSNVNLSFAAENNGMISRCGYVVNGCMDDCFTGVTISYIDKL